MAKKQRTRYIIGDVVDIDTVVNFYTEPLRGSGNGTQREMGIDENIINRTLTIEHRLVQRYPHIPCGTRGMVKDVLDTPIRGIISGGRIFCEGTVSKEYYDDDYYMGSGSGGFMMSFTCTKRSFVYCVKCSMTGPELYCFDEHISPVGDSDDFKKGFPYK